MELATVTPLRGTLISCGGGELPFRTIELTDDDF
jgi:hypothetical protein